jgi:tartrate-resistant acid phosphatase type 5
MVEYIKRENVRFDAAISTGDNFYVYMEGPGDKTWQKVFEKMYDPKIFDFPFYAVLGNHDYGNYTDDIQIRYSREFNTRWKMPARYYRLELPPGKPLVTLFMLDSNYRYPTQSDEIQRQRWSEQEAWLEQELAQPRRTPWVGLVGHHTMFSRSKRGGYQKLRNEWGALLRKHRLDYYICGHNHGLECLEVEGYPCTFLVSGGAGASLYDIRYWDWYQGFAEKMHGFAHLQITPWTSTIRLVDEHGQVVYKHTRHAWQSHYDHHLDLEPPVHQARK